MEIHLFVIVNASSVVEGVWEIRTAPRLGHLVSPAIGGFVVVAGG